MSKFIYQLREWPHFKWDDEKCLPPLIAVRHKQGRLLGKMQNLGFKLQNEANLQTLTLDVLKSSEIEGEILDSDQVRSSIARRLGLDIGGMVTVDRNVEGIVEVMIDATQNFTDKLTDERMFGWHSAMFPTGRSEMCKIVVGSWRDNSKTDPMRVVSGPIGRETIHFQAPDAEVLPDEMTAFIKWFNSNSDIDSVLKAAIAHLWFVTIHPFDDGNGRIARAIGDMQLSRSDNSGNRFYSMSTQIRKERNAYYDILERTQKDAMNVTEWVLWFLGCLDRDLDATDETLGKVLQKARFWEQHSLTTMNERQKMMMNKVLDGFTGKLNSSKWAKITKSSSDTAVRDINDLLQKNILQKDEAGGRSTSYSLKV